MTFLSAFGGTLDAITLFLTRVEQEKIRAKNEEQRVARQALAKALHPNHTSNPNSKDTPPHG